jgi:hypothetical protein
VKTDTWNFTDFLVVLNRYETLCLTLIQEHGEYLDLSSGRQEEAKRGTSFFVLFTEYCQVDKVKESEVGRRRNSNGEMRNAHTILIRTPEGST